MINSYRRINHDVIKSIAIFFLLFYHGNALDKDVNLSKDILTYVHYFFQCILSTCAPLFFMVNGSLIFNKDLDIKKHLNKIIKYYVLIFMYAFILTIVIKCIRNESFVPGDFLLIFDTDKEKYLSHLWFLKALISVYIIFPIIKFSFDENKLYLYFLYIFLFVFTIGNESINEICHVFGLYNDNKIINYFSDINPFGWTCSSLLYFITGGLIDFFIKEKKININRKLIFLLLIISQIVLFVYGTFVTVKSGNYFDVVFRGYGSVMVLLMSCSIFVILFYSNCKYFLLNKIFTWIGKNTFGIYIAYNIYRYILK